MWLYNMEEETLELKNTDTFTMKVPKACKEGVCEHVLDKKKPERDNVAL